MEWCFLCWLSSNDHWYRSQRKTETHRFWYSFGDHHWIVFCLYRYCFAFPFFVAAILGTFESYLLLVASLYWLQGSILRELSFHAILPPWLWGILVFTLLPLFVDRLDRERLSLLLRRTSCFLGLSVGKRMTSRMDCALVRSITNLSIPIPLSGCRWHSICQCFDIVSIKIHTSSPASLAFA